MSEWFQEADFWELMYPFMFSQEQFQSAVDEVDQILELLDLQGGTILDLGCGPGRHAIPLAQKGFRVTGVDLTPYLLSKARDRAESMGVQVEWVQEDMRRFTRPESFDLGVNMYSTFGYFAQESQNLAVLESVYDNLKPGGLFLIDMAGKEVIANIFAPTGAQDLEDGSLLIQRRDIREDWTRIHNQWILIQADRARTFNLEHTIYSGQEIKDRLREAGFKSVTLYGDLDGSPYDLRARHLVAGARKGV
jgi:SAM-dependent methyltransferase